MGGEKLRVIYLANEHLVVMESLQMEIRRDRESLQMEICGDREKTRMLW